MTKKITKTLSIVAACFMLVACIFLFCGCELLGDNVYYNPNAPTASNQQGKTAYDIAVENGFVGTESEWLESLKGKSAYDIAVENGFVGTESEWLESLKGASGHVSVEDDRQVVANCLMSSVSLFCAKTSTATFDSAGSGVIYKYEPSTGTAIIITNYHVVYDETNKKLHNSICVLPYGSNEYILGTFVGGSAIYDIALVKVEDKSLVNNPSIKQIEIDDSLNVVVGQTAIAIGNAQGEGISVTKGIVCVDSEDITISNVETEVSTEIRVMRIDTAVNRGNSGGGLFGADGKLIGIVNAKIIDTDVEGIGYAIPVSIATKVAENILYYWQKGNGRVVKPVLGITIQITSSNAVFDKETNAIQIVERIDVNDVAKTSPAHNLLLVGDRIVSVAKKGDSHVEVVDRIFKIKDFLLTMHQGDVLQFMVERDGALIAIDLEITSDMLQQS